MGRTSFASIAGQFRDILLTQIEEGHYARGQKIESERALAERYGVSRVTVRKGLGELARDGILVRRSARGTFVSDNPPLPANVSPQRRPIRRLGLCFLDLGNVDLHDRRVRGHGVDSRSTPIADNTHFARVGVEGERQVAQEALSTQVLYC